MIGTIILAAALFMLFVATALMYMALISMRPSKTVRQVNRQRIPADWNRILSETELERRESR
jgi:hypothetical protein